MGKQFAKDMFNRPFSPIEKKRLLTFTTTNKIKNSFILKKQQEISIDDIDYTPLESAKAMAAVFDFILCAGECKTWLQKQLLTIGWTENQTGYNPISASHSTNEVLAASVECFKMACKQKIKLFQ